MNQHQHLALTALALALISLGTACGTTGTATTRPQQAPAVTASPSIAPEQLLGPERRLRMPIAGLSCEGPEDALVTIVEYVGYQCPFTRRLEPTVRRLLSEHTGEVRFCIRHYVIPADQPHGLLAAHTALETFRLLGPGAFFRLHRAMLDVDLDPATIVQLAAAQGVDEAALRAALDSNRHEAALLSDRDLLRSLDRSGTPQLFIAGRLVSGAKPYEEVAPVLIDAIEEARRLVASGVGQAELYEVVQRNSLAQVDPPVARPGEPARVRIRFIDVATRQHPLADEPRSMSEARTLADRIVAQIRAGADFGELARQWSVASNAARGGEFGWVRRGTLTEETEDVAMALEVEELAVSCDPGGRSCRVIQRLE